MAFDTQILVWGIRGEGEDWQLERARWLLDRLDDETQVVIPTMVLSEFLVPVEPDHHAGTIAAIADRFMVAPFDLRAAQIAAELHRRWRSKGRPVDRSRTCLKADIVIIATAKASGVNVLYSNDEGLRKIAGDAVDARDLPDTPPDLYSR